MIALAASNPNSVRKEIAFYICLEHFKLKPARNILKRCSSFWENENDRQTIHTYVSEHEREREWRHECEVSKN